MTVASRGEDVQPELQRDVQRLLGRCLLRIQQYEGLLKAMLANHELAGPVDTLENQRAERIEKRSGKSLGMLVKELFEDYVVPEGFERELLEDGHAPTDRISMAFSFRMSMAPDDRNKTKAAIEELVDLRNQLVHHFIERFDVWTEAGCVGAVRQLEAIYERIDRHFLELSEWASRMDEAGGMFAQLTQTSVFRDSLINDIAPDVSFEWFHTSIVRVLRDASRKLSKGGWTRLDQARGWIAENHPDQTPEKYGCRTWPQVLTESRHFDVQYRTDEGGSKVPWFRERSRQ